MRLIKNKIILVLSLLIPLGIAVMYNACGRIGNGYVTTGSANGLLFGLSSGCSGPLLSNYSQTFHPYLVSNCNGCHSSAHGSSDLNISFQAFMAKGESLIVYQATHAHGGNNFGPQMQAPIDAFLPSWHQAMDSYNSCNLSGGSSNSSPSQVNYNSLRTIGKSLPTVSTSYKDLTFDLETDLYDQSQKYPVILNVKVKYFTYLGTIVGFTFNDPTLKLKPGATGTYTIGDIHFILDEIPQDFVTTYMTALMNVNTTTATSIAPGFGSAPDYYDSASATTKIAIDIRKFAYSSVDSSGSMSSSGGNSGGTTTTIPAYITFANLNSADANLGVFKNKCNGCHSGASAKGGLDLTNYTQAKNSSSAVLSRMKSTGNPMPPSGVLPATSIDVVNNWINSGTPQ